MTNATATLPAMRLGEIVLKTGRYEELRAWYARVLGMEPSLDRIVPRHASKADEPSVMPTRTCFFRMHADHPWQDVVAVFEVMGTSPHEGQACGLHHMQLRNDSVDVLGARYRRLRDAGVMPYRAMDHGPTTSLYYADPDRNVVELAASNFASARESLACLASERYRNNPAGEAIDPEARFG